MQKATDTSAAKKEDGCLTSALYLNVMYPCAQIKIEKIFQFGQYFFTVQTSLLNPSFAITQ